MRCLILGATGQIGSHLLANVLDRGLPCLGTTCRRPRAGLAELDVRDRVAVDELLADYQPDVTFLAAGLTCAGFADAHPQLCRDTVLGGARNVARAVAAHGGRLVHFGTDEVFGDCPSARREDDERRPAGGFAQAHADAEDAIREALPAAHLIVRTSWVFGPDRRGHNRAATVLGQLRRGDAVRASAAAHGQPTFAPDLAEAAVELARVGEAGTVHAVGPERHTAFTFARLVAQLFRHDADLVEAVEAGTPRPDGVWLDRGKLRQLLGPRAIRPTADGLRAMRQAQAGLARAA